MDATASAIDMKSIMAEVKPDMQKALSVNLRDVFMETSKQVIRSYSGGVGSMTDSAYKAMLNNNKAYSSGLAAISKEFGFTDKAMDAMVNMAIRQQPAILRRDYMKQLAQNSGGRVSPAKVTPDYETYLERLPEIYRN